MKKWDKTILAVLLQWDYGISERGVSCEKLWFYDNLTRLAERVEVLWYDEYLEDVSSLQEVLLDRAREINPDLIFFIPFKDQFSFETLDSLKKQCATIAWFGDDTWRFNNFSSKYSPHFTYVATTDPMSVSKHRKVGAQPILTEWAAAEPVSEEIGPLSEDEPYKYEVSFVGGINLYRSWFIERLTRMGIIVDCFGAGWPNGRVSFEQMEQIFRKSRINLNLSNSVCHDIRFVLAGIRNLALYFRSQKRAEQVKARNFEIPLAGGFQLSNYVLGLERHLRIGEEIAIYSTPEDCAEQIGFYLENEKERMAIVLHSHERARKEHTYLHRLARIMEHIWG